MTVLNTGSTKQFASGWERIFENKPKKKQAEPRPTAKKATPKKGSAKPAASLKKAPPTKKPAKKRGAKK